MRKSKNRRKRSVDEIIGDLKKIWGENWDTNMAIIAEAPDAADRIPQSQIDASNNLVWELNSATWGGKINEY